MQNLFFEKNEEFILKIPLGENCGQLLTQSRLYFH